MVGRNDVSHEMNKEQTGESQESACHLGRFFPISPGRQGASLTSLLVIDELHVQWLTVELPGFKSQLCKLESEESYWILVP